MSFLSRPNYQIEALKPLNNYPVFKEFYHRNLVSRSDIGHYRALILKLGLIYQGDINRSLKPAVLSFVADHGVALSKTFRPYFQKDSQEFILHLLSKPTYTYLGAQKVQEINHRIIDLGTERTDDSNSTFWIHRGKRLISAKINKASADFAQYPAMTTSECYQALATGEKLVERESFNKSNLLVLNSFGRGEELSFFSLFAALENQALVEVWEPKYFKELDIACIEDLSKAIRKNPLSHDPFTILSFYGSYETAALCGAILKAAEAKIPIVLSSSMAKVAALIAQRINSAVKDYCIIGQNGYFETEKIINKRLGNTFIDLSETSLKEPLFIGHQIQMLESMISELTEK